MGRLDVAELFDGEDGPKLKTEVAIPQYSDLTKFLGHNPPFKPDFKEGFVVGIGLGQRPTNGFDVAVVEAFQETNGIAAGLITVLYEETPPSGPTATVLTFPFVVARITGTEWATMFAFKSVPPRKWIVIAPVAEPGGKRTCQTVPDGSIILATHTVVHGPASRGECNKYCATHCDR